MKAIMLTAGEATRMKPISFTLPKPLTPVGNQPLLSYGLRAIRQAGIEQVGIVVSPEVRSIVSEKLGDGSDWNVQTRYIEQAKPRGLAHAVQVSRDFIGDDSFVMYLGDNVLQRGLTDIVRKFKDGGANAVIALYEVDNPSAFGIAELDGGRIKRVVEKPKDPSSNLAIIGVYVFDRQVFTAIDNIKPSWRNELEITDAIQYLIANGYIVEPHIVEGWWIDAGNPTDMIRANRLVLDELKSDEAQIRGRVDENSGVSARVNIDTGSQIVNSIVREPVVIGADCKLINAYVGPFTAIGDRVVIENSEVEQSIIMDDCVIRNVEGRISGSIFADKCMLTKTGQEPPTHRFVLAERSLVEL